MFKAPESSRAACWWSIMSLFFFYGDSSGTDDSKVVGTTCSLLNNPVENFWMHSETVASSHWGRKVGWQWRIFQMLSIPGCLMCQMRTASSNQSQGCLPPPALTPCSSLVSFGDRDTALPFTGMLEERTGLSWMAPSTAEARLYLKTDFARECRRTEGKEHTKVSWHGWGTSVLQWLPG